MVLGDCLEDNVVTYVDDVVVHSVCSEDHLRHLDTERENSPQQGSQWTQMDAAFVYRRLSF